jgi:hypothetical protein
VLELGLALDLGFTGLAWDSFVGDDHINNNIYSVYNNAENNNDTLTLTLTLFMFK